MGLSGFIAACERVPVNARLGAMSCFWQRAFVRHGWTWFMLLTCLALVGLSSCATSPGSDGADSDNLLAHRSAVDSSGVSRPGRLTDGRAAEEGDDWRTQLTAVLRSRDAYVVYDLGQSMPIVAVSLQGDANDTYSLFVSDDGQSYELLWAARPVRGSGMQTRTATGLEGRGRYVKLQASGGDGRYSVGELGVWSRVPDPFPPTLRTSKGKPSQEDAEQRMQIFGLVAAVFLLMHRRDSPWWMKALVIVPVGFGISLGLKLSELWPLEQAELTLLRATIAAVAMVAVIRQYFPGKAPADSRWTTATLGLLAVLAFGCYYNFGMPQFRDEAKGRQTLVHPWDMRVYFPLVKYFRELRFDGLYLASLAAYVDNNPNVGESGIAHTRLRDLNNNEVKVAAEVMPDIRAVRDRFTPERWESFRKDMKYFQDLMGAGGYLGSLRDHGGNATPVWILSATPFWAWSPANEWTLSLTALLDPLLLLAMLVVVGRTFGWRVAFLLAIGFGTTDLSRFGTNLMGSTLRLDWMVALGFGACALYKKRWMAGGALLAYAGLIRGFPAFATLFLAAPFAMAFVDWARTKDRPAWREGLREAFPPFLRSAAGAIACVLVLVALSSAVFGYQASWGNWFYKISIHQDKPNVNHVGLRNILSYESDRTGKQVLRPELPEPWTDWQKYQLAAFDRRKPLFYGGILLFTGLAVAASRRRHYHQAAMMGLLMIPVFFYPANYYCHYVFLLPLLAVDRKDTDSRLFGWVALVLLAMSVALYPTLQERQVDVLYTLQSDVILAGFFLILVPMAYFAWRSWPNALAVADGPSLFEESSDEGQGSSSGRKKTKRRKKAKDRAMGEAGSTKAKGASEAEEASESVASEAAASEAEEASRETETTEEVSETKEGEKSD